MFTKLICKALDHSVFYKLNCTQSVAEIQSAALSRFGPGDK